jgi:ABC-type phosphate/phosphonate transport system substrate-binding protein
VNNEARVGLIPSPFFMASESLSAEERQRWQDVLTALEKAGKQDSYFYRRAVAIVETGRDPMRW